MKYLLCRAASDCMYAMQFLEARECRRISLEHERRKGLYPGFHHYRAEYQ